MSETWERYAPALAGLERVGLIFAGGGTPREVDVPHATNVEQLRAVAHNHRCSEIRCLSGELVLVDTETGQAIPDTGDVSAAGRLGQPVILRVSTLLAELIAARRLELVRPDGGPFDVDLEGVLTFPSLRSRLASHTSRPEALVGMHLISSGERKPILQYQIPDPGSTHVRIEVALVETVAESCASGLLAFVDGDGAPLDADLSGAHTLNDVKSILGERTSRPPRMVRFLLQAQGETKEVKVWDATQFSREERATLVVQLAPTIAELLTRHRVTVVSALSAELLPLDAATVGGLVSIQDLREAIAQLRGLRATGVKLLTVSGQQLWDSQPFDLCEVANGNALSVCIRDPDLCARGEHEEMFFLNNGYNDRVCIHCGQEWLMEGRVREPIRRTGFVG